MGIIRGSYQLHIDAHLIICFLDATFQEIGDAELVRNLSEILRCVFITLCGRARDHFEIPNLGKASKNLILDAVSEISVRFVFTAILKWQNGDGFFIWRWPRSDEEKRVGKRRGRQDPRRQGE